MGASDVMRAIFAPEARASRTSVEHPLVVRAARADDTHLLAELIGQLSPESRFHRFHLEIPHLPDTMRAGFASFDRRRDLVLVAATLRAGREVVVAEARHAAPPDGTADHEFALVVHQDFRRRGLGELLLRRLVAHALDHGVRRLHGDVVRDNLAMLTLSARVGFMRERHPEDPRLVRVVLPLDGCGRGPATASSCVQSTGPLAGPPSGGRD
jgi:GNAT superfamily N-acetyltransferase